MKLTRHNGRSGENGTYNPKHNDRRFDVKNSEHIDPERTRQNVYWDCFNGFRTFADQEEEPGLAETFEDVELLFYKQQYGGYVARQNARNAKTRHTERNRSPEDLLKHKKTCPEETVYQIGTKDEHVSPEILLQVVTDFFAEMERRFGSHIHTLDWALHLDESTPHIQERHVFDCENRYGEIAPQQEKALEALGFEPPEPDKPISRYNNRKMTFDSACRAMLFDITRRYGLHLDEEPEYGGRRYLEKQDYILMKQKEQLAAQAAAIQVQTDEISRQGQIIESQEMQIGRNDRQLSEQSEQLEELSMRIEDVEALIDEVSDIAYDKAVEVVTDTVRLETHEADIQMIEDTKKWLLAPERKAPKKEREYAVARLDGVIGKIRNAMQTTLAKIQKKLLRPEVKKQADGQIKEQAKPSIIARLQQNQAEVARRNAEQRKPTNRKHEQEL